MSKKDKNKRRKIAKARVARDRKDLSRGASHTHGDIDMRACMRCGRPRTQIVEATTSRGELSAISCDEHVEFFVEEYAGMDASSVRVKDWPVSRALR